MTILSMDQLNIPQMMLDFSKVYYSDHLKSLFANYGDDDFFQQFIYPYLSRETILNISDKIFFIDLVQHMRDICYQLNATVNYEEESRRHETNPRSTEVDEPPLKRVIIFPLGLSMLYYCKYLSNHDLLILSRDVRFMQELNKRLNQLEVTREKLLRIRKTF